MKSDKEDEKPKWFGMSGTMSFKPINDNHLPKEKGGHDYGEPDAYGIKKCANCGCTISKYTAFGPMGLDPFGNCPNSKVITGK